jgi:hypothetical protein
VASISWLTSRGFHLVASTFRWKSSTQSHFFLTRHTRLDARAFVVVLLYPVDGQKQSSKNIDDIRAQYMRQHQQESVLRVDDPFLVRVSF